MGEILEWTFAHCYEIGGMRRLHVCSDANIRQRLIVQTTDFIAILVAAVWHVSSGTGILSRTIWRSSLTSFKVFLDVQPIIAVPRNEKSTVIEGSALLYLANLRDGGFLPDGQLSSNLRGGSMRKIDRIGATRGRLSAFAAKSSNVVLLLWSIGMAPAT